MLMIWTFGSRSGFFLRPGNKHIEISSNNHFFEFTLEDMARNVEKNTYTETQFLYKTWIGKLTILVTLSLLIALWYYYFFQENKPNGFSVSIQVISFLAVIVLLISNLKVKHHEDTIELKYFPFHIRKITYSTDDIKSIEFSKFDPLSDFGGWGTRFSKGIKCFTVSGNEGMKITF